MAVAELKAMVSLDTRKYKAGMNQINRENKKMRAQMESVGRAIGVSFGAAAALAAVVKIGKALKAWAEDASIAARKVGVMTSEMIALRRIAIQSGTDMGQMQRVLSKLQTELFRASTGVESSAKKFEDLGLSISELNRMSPADMLQAVAVAAQETERPLVLLTELFGERLGPNAMIALKDIAENGLGPLNDQLGVTADRIELLGSKWAKGADQAKGWGTSVLAVLGEVHESYTAFWGAVFSDMTSPVVSESGSTLGAGLKAMRRVKEQRKKDLQEATEDRKTQQRETAEQMSKEYIRSLEKELKAEEDKIAAAMEKATGRAKVRAPEIAGIERMGAAFGNMREGLPVAERQLAIQREQLKVEQQNGDKLDQIKQELESARGNLR